MSLISLSQYGVRVGTVYDESSPGTVEEQIQAFLDDASALANLIAFGPTTADYWDDADESGDNPLPDAVVPVIVNMVRRAHDNPRGLTGEQLGDYQWQATASGQTSIYATRAERSIIRRAAGKLGVAALSLEGYLPTSGVEFIEDELPIP
jgi:hypothetical protein